MSVKKREIDNFTTILLNEDMSQAEAMGTSEEHGSAMESGEDQYADYDDSTEDDIREITNGRDGFEIVTMVGLPNGDLGFKANNVIGITVDSGPGVSTIVDQEAASEIISSLLSHVLDNQ